MKRVVILGAGGLGRQVLAQLQVDYGHGIDWVIGGFLDERGADAVSPALYYPWLGEPMSFVPASDHLFVAAIGDPAMRKRQVVPLLAKGAEFISVRTRCMLGARTVYGPTYFGYDVSCGVDSRIGGYGFIDQDVLLGHDVDIGDYVHIGPRCVLAGNVKVGEGAVINTGALIARGVTIGEGAVVGMGSVVFKDVAAGQTVVGNPARSIFNKPVDQA
ncbi:acetyltransferase [Xanthomonas campestris]|uniref:Acetyltransferase n=1 Tax=Xanthomonas campestris pv. papavericola TaxID=487881 RepID=A0AAJ3CF96_XANCA|nr:acetyltransferase [Xanthomonas campestris]KIQ23899.1 transferase [Xanthomonas campestris]MCC5071512.1 acetyltransferase [Xanthomonas campestris pv. plantaginis]MEA0738501.1 acetyltransferase [Xanthomonas campestris pv. campestris]MEB2187929.1 acetyltransferase [Xanthomonas campestris pv. campestris]MEB2230759.1 acetyltransferase [Xanthomonas campestris pv. campestris]